MEQWNTPGDYASPDFSNPGRCHDWLNYVTPELVAMWSDFSDDQKKVIACTLQVQADREDWE